MMMARQVFIPLAVLLLSFVSACAPSSPNNQSAHVSIQLQHSSALKTTSDPEYTLPHNLCYVIHVTGAGLDKLPPDPNGCGPATGLGVASARAYHYTEQAEISVQNGSQRNFQLLGFESPLGVDATSGYAICGTFTIEILPSAAGQTHSKVQSKVNGTLVTAPFIRFYEGLADIAPGENVVTLAPVALVVTPFTSAYTFGAPLDRQNLPGAAANAFCRAASRVVNAPLMSPTSAAVTAPITSTNGAAILHMVTSVPTLMPAPVRSTSGNYELKTGLGEIIHGK